MNENAQSTIAPTPQIPSKFKTGSPFLLILIALTVMAIGVLLYIRQSGLLQNKTEDLRVQTNPEAKQIKNLDVNSNPPSNVNNESQTSNTQPANTLNNESSKDVDTQINDLNTVDLNSNGLDDSSLNNIGN